MRVEYNDNYRMVRALWIEKRLSELPDIKLGESHGVKVARKYRTSKAGKRTNHTYVPNGKGYLEAINIAELRLRLLKEKSQLPYAEGRICKIGKIRMTKEKWDSLIPSANDIPITGSYYHKGIRMRSRFELLVAEVLSDMNLQFKYEVELGINGETVYPDFLVYIPELEMCFIIECLGKLDDPGYVYRNSRKLMNYLVAGFELDKDLLFFSGKADFLPDTEFIRNQIVRHINGLMDESLQK